MGSQQRKHIIAPSDWMVGDKQFQRRQNRAYWKRIARELKNPKSRYHGSRVQAMSPNPLCSCKECMDARWRYR